jgi:hypothetical protein
MGREGIEQAVSKSKLSILADNDFDRRSPLEIWHLPKIWHPIYYPCVN